MKYEQLLESDRQWEEFQSTMALPRTQNQYGRSVGFCKWTDVNRHDCWASRRSQSKCPLTMWSEGGSIIEMYKWVLTTHHGQQTENSIAQLTTNTATGDIADHGVHEWLSRSPKEGIFSGQDPVRSKAEPFCWGIMGETSGLFLTLVWFPQFSPPI